jgi:hypothetical protein
MRTKLGWALAALGVLCALLGLAVMVILGPDSRFSTGPHTVNTDGIAVVTAPKVITWADVQVDILAEVPVKKPIFVGLGNSVDVQNLVGKTQRLEVTAFHTPWKPVTRQVSGTPNLPGAPTALDWWIADSAGLGGASISTTLPDQTVSVAIFAVGSTNLSGLKVSLAYGVKGGFAKGTGLLILGAGTIWTGLLLRRDAALWSDELDEGEDVLYVYVDEDGVEHEISAEEAQAYDVVEEVVVEHAPDETFDELEQTVERVAPALTPPKPAGVMTAGEIAGIDEPEAQHVQVHEKTGTTDERVVYVFVDEDGVEHEVSEDELGDFEIVDEEDES